MGSIFYRYRLHFALGLTALILAGGLAGWLGLGQIRGMWHGWMDETLTLARGAPFPVFILLVGVLPMVGVPVTGLYLVAGAVYSPVFGWPAALGGICLGLLLNLLLSYGVARCFRRPVDQLLRRFGAKIPTFAGLPVWKVILLVRITPGTALMMQNLLLGLAGVPLGLYLVVSLAAEAMIALGYMTAGRSFATGHWGLLPMGLAAIVIAALAASLMRDRMNLKNANQPGSR